MKRYFLMYDSDQTICGRKRHTGGNGNSIKICKGYIRTIRKNEAQYNPRNFTIYDSFAEIEDTGFVPEVYHED